jgi:hypothetical protein
MERTGVAIPVAAALAVVTELASQTKMVGLVRAVLTVHPVQTGVLELQPLLLGVRWLRAIRLPMVGQGSKVPAEAEAEAEAQAVVGVPPFRVMEILEAEAEAEALQVALEMLALEVEAEVHPSGFIRLPAKSWLRIAA